MQQVLSTCIGLTIAQKVAEGKGARDAASVVRVHCTRDRAEGDRAEGGLRWSKCVDVHCTRDRAEVTEQKGNRGTASVVRVHCTRDRAEGDRAEGG